MSKSKEKDRVAAIEVEDVMPEAMLSEPDPVLVAETPAEKAVDGESVPVAETIVEQRIYLGPSFKELRHGQVFIGTLPEALLELVRQCPFIEKLLIPVQRATAARREMSKPNSAYSLYASKILAFQAGRRKD